MICVESLELVSLWLLLVITTAIIIPIPLGALTIYLPDLISDFRERSRFTRGEVRVGQ